MRRLLIVFALVISSACSEKGRSPTTTDELATTASAAVDGRVVTPSGALISRASTLLIAIQKTPQNPSNVPVFYDAPGMDVDSMGRFKLVIKRNGLISPPPLMDTMSAQLITRVPSNSTNAQTDTVLLRFSSSGVMLVPTVVEVRWRGAMPQ